MATELQRTHMAGLARMLIANEPKIGYRQRRPMASRTILEQELADSFAHGGFMEMDCSEAVTLICRMAGLRNPNGRTYASGLGYTGDMLAYLEHYTSPSAAGVGALVVYGPGNGDHVSMVITPGKDPLLFSHGFDGGPVAIRFSAQRAAHRAPATFLSIMKL